ncbi:MAG TPA: ABC transporter ATP-binding protein [Marinilabiliales bacterium]|jgi:putative ABC transport system permease protein|nr:ABC transporter ATP-binding protein [Marinilabiliales bacterium]
MIDFDKWSEIMQALKKNRLRTFLTAFGVFWGIFMLVIMLGSGNGLHNAVYDNMGDFSTNSCFMWTQTTTMSYKGFSRGRRFNFNNGDTEMLLQNIPEIKALSPRLNGWTNTEGNNAIRGDKAGAFSIMGDYPAWNVIDPYEITQGRFINDIDIKENRKVIAIGQKVVEALFLKGENPIGQYIKINGIYFNVVGTFKSKKGGGQAEHEEQNIHMPFTTLQKTYNFGDMVGWYAISAHDDVPVDIVETKARAILKSRHKIHPDDERAIGGFNVAKEFRKMNGLFLGINTLIWIVGIGTLLAGVIGVSNIMLVIVKERTKEIGIQRALGAKPIKVISQIISESVFLTSLAGILGLSSGVWLVELINRSLANGGGDMFKNPEVDIKVASIALIVLIISGAFAGLLPASRAVSIKPIDAIRQDK